MKNEKLIVSLRELKLLVRELGVPDDRNEIVMANLINEFIKAVRESVQRDRDKVQ